MKQLAFLFLAVAFLVSCNNVGKYADAINGLSDEWTSATNAVTEFSQNLQDEQINWKSMLDDMTMTDAAMAELPEEVQGKVSELTSACQSFGPQYAAISGEVMKFVGEWTEKEKGLTALKEGLTAGKLPEDVQAQIDGLKEYATNGATQLDGWKTKFEELKGQAAAAFKEHSDFLASLEGEG